jgi:hypothetical protein
MTKRLRVTALLMLALLTGCAPPVGRRQIKSDASSNKSGATNDERAEDVRAVRVSKDGLNAAEPAIAAAPDGAIYVAWVAHGAGKGADVWVTRFDAEGKQAVEPARVNQTPGEATAWRGDAPSVAVTPDGTICVAWTARAGEGGHAATTLYVSTSRDGGMSFGAPVRVNDDAGEGVHGMHSLAVGRDSRIHVAWLDERDLTPPSTAKPTAPTGSMKPDENMNASKASGGMHGEQNREVFYASSSDAGRTFSRNRRVATEACPCCKTALAVGADGRVYLGWRQVLPGDFRHVAVASSNDGGATFSAPNVVSDDRWELKGCPVSGPSLVAGDENALRVLWYTAGEAGAEGLYISESRDGGRTFTPRRAVMEGGVRGTPALVADGHGGFVALFEGTGEASSPALLESRLDATMRAAGGAARILTGEVPTATMHDGRLYAAYVSRDGVWMVKVV